MEDSVMEWAWAWAGMRGSGCTRGRWSFCSSFPSPCPSAHTPTFLYYVNRSSTSPWPLISRHASFVATSLHLAIFLPYFPTTLRLPFPEPLHSRIIPLVIAVLVLSSTHSSAPPSAHRLHHPPRVLASSSSSSILESSSPASHTSRPPYVPLPIHHKRRRSQHNPETDADLPPLPDDVEMELDVESGEGSGSAEGRPSDEGTPGARRKRWCGMILGAGATWCYGRLGFGLVRGEETGGRGRLR
ncbi:hypothetical protein DFH09DRAFT_1329765 [Mycena vulgaris]|nr:hypothetical protein DFH09DRAFT_1329765 [Mycena vulgaris]